MVLRLRYAIVNDSFKILKIRLCIYVYMCVCVCVCVCICSRLNLAFKKPFIPIDLFHLGC